MYFIYVIFITHHLVLYGVYRHNIVVLLPSKIIMFRNSIGLISVLNGSVVAYCVVELQ